MNDSNLHFYTVFLCTMNVEEVQHLTFFFLEAKDQNERKPKALNK